jgi:hypothetical protein
MTFTKYLKAKWEECDPDAEDMSQRCKEYNKLLLMIDDQEPPEDGKKLTWLNRQLERGKASKDFIKTATTIFYEYHEIEARRQK